MCILFVMTFFATANVLDDAKTALDYLKIYHDVTNGVIDMQNKEIREHIEQHKDHGFSQKEAEVRAA